MLANQYLPEGYYLENAENREYLSGLAALERAMNEGKILEAPAVRCGSDLTLTVELGGYFGYIKKEESTLTYEDDAVKDIAVITRVGKPVCFKVISIERDSYGEPKIMLSRRAAQLECTENYLSTLIPGDIIPARVTHLEQFGAFVDIGCGVISLLSIDCMSVSRISHPKDRFSIGMDIRCIIRKNEESGRRIYVSHKELLGTWRENAENFCVGQTVTGVVRSIEEYGIFIELSPNLAGLAEYKEDITVGQSAAVFIKNIIPERMKIKLVIIDTYKGLKPSPGCRFRYYVGSDVTHISDWKYSPNESNKCIETMFD